MLSNESNLNIYENLKEKTVNNIYNDLVKTKQKSINNKNIKQMMDELL